jgi:hypothetical protein
MVISGDAEKRRTWEARFAMFHASGLSVSRFCKQERVSTHRFYYWVKRLRAASVPTASRAEQGFSLRPASAASTTDHSPQGPVVRFRGKTGTEVLVPAECLDVIRCLAECLAPRGGQHAEAFQEVVVKA